MAEEPVGQPNGASAETPQTQEPDWASIEVEITPGKKMPLGKVPKSYAESERLMHEATERAARLEEENKQLEFAKTVQKRYWSEPDFRERYDALFQDQPEQSRPIAPEIEALNQRVSELQIIKFERDFDKLRAMGLDVSKDDEVRALNEVRMGRAHNVEQAYKSIFFDREMSRRAEKASTSTAQHMAETRNVYAPPPKGGGPSKSSPQTMTAAERRARALKELGDVLGE